MSDTDYFKYVNVVDDKTGRPIIDKDTRRPVTRRVQMTDEEIAGFEAERSKEQNKQGS